MHNVQVHVLFINIEALVKYKNLPKIPASSFRTKEENLIVGMNNNFNANSKYILVDFRKMHMLILKKKDIEKVYLKWLGKSSNNKDKN